MGRAAGFTLIELLIVVALVAILGAITVPQLAEGLERYAVISAGQQVTSTIRAARFQAVGKNMQLRVRFDYPVAGQYQVVLHSNGTTAIGQVQQLPNGVGFVAGAVDVAFDTNGRMPTGAAASTVGVTNGNANDDRTITVSTSGRVELD